MFVPAVIKLHCLEKFLFSPAQKSNDWAKSLYILGSAISDLPGVEIVGVAPDFNDWYVCFYLSFEHEARTLSLLRWALVKSGGSADRCYVVTKAAEFGRKSGHRRVMMRIEQSAAPILATLIRSRSVQEAKRTAPLPELKAAVL